MGMSVLNDRQVTQFHRDGFTVVERMFDADALRGLQSAVHRIIDEYDVAANKSVFSTKDGDSGRDELFFRSAETVECFLEADALNAADELIKPPRLSINKIGHALHDHVTEFGEFCRQPSIASALRDIGYQSAVLFQTMVILKPPEIGGEVRWHQDASYLISEPASVCGIWVALEDANRQNGCLWMQPGEHKSPLRERYTVDWKSRTGTLAQLDDTPWLGQSEPVALEVPRGSAVFFNDHMPHYSAANTSEKSRLAFTMHVREQNTQWSDENWLQRPRLGDFLL